MKNTEGNSEQHSNENSKTEKRDLKKKKNCILNVENLVLLLSHLQTMKQKNKLEKDAGETVIKLERK